MKKISITIVVCFVLSGVLTLIGGNVNDTDVRTRFMAKQASQYVAQSMMAYQQYIDEGVAGTTIVYNRYKSGLGSVFIYRQTVVETPTSTSVSNEKTVDTWANKETATYTPFNED